MRLIFSFFGLFALFCSFHLQADIIETPHFSELQNHVKPQTLILLDIDDTLLIPTQTLGTDVWFLDRYHQLKQEGYSQATALDRALGEWEAVRHLTQVKIVEEGSDKIVRDLQQKGFTIMGLTTQTLELSTRTVEQLKQLGFDLSLTAPGNGTDVYFLNKHTHVGHDHGVLYRRGILFTSGTIKSLALLKLLKLIDYRPQEIIFINDKQSHIQDVEQAAKELGIPFIGLRYSYSDNRVANYNTKIAKIQFERSSFHRILSDEEAMDILLKEDLATP